jgi:hypothetical protein
MNRTGHLCAAVSVVFLAAAACGSNDPAAPATGTGGVAADGGAGGGGAGGAGGGGAGGSVPGDDGGTATGGTVGGDTPPATGEYFPFKVGNSWEYAVTELNKAAVNKVHKITKMEVIGGTGPYKDMMAYRVETQKSSGSAPADATISWQVREGNRVVRYRETSCAAGSVMPAPDGSIGSCAVNEEDWWMPARVVIDEQPTNMAYAAGLTWPENYMEWIVTYSFKVMPPAMMTAPVAAKTDTWLIVNPAGSITTPAGTFNDCVIVKKTSMANATKTYTYCRGVGKVKEEGASASSQTETLVRFTLM